MRDKSHVEHVERWARFVAGHSRSEWIKYVKPIIDAQFQMNSRFLEKLAKTESGAKKIVKIYRIKNKKGYKKLLKKIT